MDLRERILKRADFKCELCLSNSNLEIYEVPPVSDGSLEKIILTCDICRNQIEEIVPMDINHWHCLNESMWSEHYSVQVMAWRILNRLKGESWAMDLLAQLYLPDDTQKWAEALDLESNQKEDIKLTVDSNGVLLDSGDTVSLIKDLDVKGASFTAKRGTIVKKITLTDNPEHVEGRVNGVQIVLKTCFLKKVN